MTVNAHREFFPFQQRWKIYSRARIFSSPLFERQDGKHIHSVLVRSNVAIVIKRHRTHLQPWEHLCHKGSSVDAAIFPTSTTLPLWRSTDTGHASCFFQHLYHFRGDKTQDSSHTLFSSHPDSVSADTGLTALFSTFQRGGWYRTDGIVLNLSAGRLIQDWRHCSQPFSGEAVDTGPTSSLP